MFYEKKKILAISYRVDAELNATLMNICVLFLFHVKGPLRRDSLLFLQRRGKPS